MTRSDQPFERPFSSNRPGSPVSPEPDTGASGNTGDASMAPPMFLDPELHPSVWRERDPSPAAEPTSPEVHAPEESSGPDQPVDHRRRRRAGWISVVAGVVALALAAVPTLLQQPFDATPPVVLSMPTLPTLSWTAAAGEPCAQHFTDDHMILSDSERVWSLDLRDGTERWSVTPSALFKSVVCLPGANVVAVTENTATDDPFNITLLDGSTGRALAVLPGSDIKQVLPLGEEIGLLSTENVLSMVARDRLDVPLWTRDFSIELEDHAEIWPQPIGKDVVQLYLDSSGIEVRSIVVSLGDGRNPEWFSAEDEPQSFYTEINGVVLKLVFDDDGIDVTALDQTGQVLWEAPSSYPILSGEQLYVFQLNDTNASERLVEVDPGSGVEVRGTSYKVDFWDAVPYGDGRLAIVGLDGVTLLDERMTPRATMGSGDMVSLVAGAGQVFIADNETNITAFSTDDYTLQWTLELDGRQSILQMGQHLVVLDTADDTIRGLSSSP